jgi:hypothetical protein
MERREFELDSDGNIIKPPKPFLVIETYSPGLVLHCPQCKSTSILILFGSDFVGRLRGEWKEKIREKRTILCNEYAKVCILSEGKITSSSNPNWICKNCYEAGVIIDEQ